MSQGRSHYRLILVGAFALAASAFAPAVWALQLTATYVGVQAGGTVSFMEGASQYYRGVAGQMGLEIVSGDFVADDLSPDVGNLVLAYCVEPTEGVSPGSTYTWNVKSLDQTGTQPGSMGLVKSQQIQDLLYHVGDPFSATFGDQQALALQIGIWEIVKEVDSGPYSVLTGTTWFQNATVAGAIGLAESWLNSYVNDTLAGPYDERTLGLSRAGTQDLMVQQVQQVPVPATWLLLLPLAWFARRHS